MIITFTIMKIIIITTTNTNVIGLILTSAAITTTIIIVIGVIVIQKGEVKLNKQTDKSPELYSMLTDAAHTRASAERPYHSMTDGQMGREGMQREGSRST